MQDIWCNLQQSGTLNEFRKQSSGYKTDMQQKHEVNFCYIKPLKVFDSLLLTHNLAYPDKYRSLGEKCLQNVLEKQKAIVFCFPKERKKKVFTKSCSTIFGQKCMLAYYTLKVQFFSRSECLKMPLSCLYIFKSNVCNFQHRHNI